MRENAQILQHQVPPMQSIHHQRPKNNGRRAQSKKGYREDAVESKSEKKNKKDAGYQNIQVA